MKLSCIEAEWEWDPFDRQTVAPMLDLLERQELAQCTHRDAVTEGELLYLVERWADSAPFRGFRYLYIASHGASGKVWFAERRKTNITRVAQRISGCPSARHRIVHFGSCSVLANDQLAEDFIALSGIGALYGYATPVEWIESAVLDLLLMQATADCFDGGTSLPAARHRAEIAALLADHAAMVSRLGLRVWVRKGRGVQRLQAPSV